MAVRPPLIQPELADARATEPAIPLGRPDARAVLEICAAVLSLATITAGAMLLATGTTRYSHVFIPGSKLVFPHWMGGILGDLGPQLRPRQFGPLMALMWVAYVGAYATCRRVPTKALVALVLVVDLLITLGPPLMSADVFGYIGYARLGTVHSLNPYLHGIGSAPGDVIVKYSRWHHEVTPYGPLFTAFTYLLAPLGIVACLWALKLTALGSVLACSWLVWRLALTQGADQRRALVFFAFNPLLLAYALGGAHNDLLLMAVVLGGLLAVALQRSGASAALMAAALGVKATAMMFVPFAFVAAPDKRRFAAYGAGVLVLIAVFSLAAFGPGAAGAIAGQIVYQQKLVATGSIPMQLSLNSGYDHLAIGFRLIALAVPVFVFAAAMVYAWRSGRWLAGAGWTALAVVLSTAWLTPWYALWVVPVAAAAASKRLVVATGLLTAYLILDYSILPFYMHVVR